jgi:DNA-directed RNA polymerase specialized sigma24 family protein
MARPRSAPADPVEAKLEQVAGRLDDIARLLAVLVARDRSLQDAVAQLSGVGFGPTRIAELLGTSAGYAKVAANRARKRKAAGKVEQIRE